MADDTCASFANVDLLAAADVVVSSLTKAFSGYADVMAGSLVLNPNSAPHAYTALKQAVSSRFRNELFAADAAHLVSNHADYFARCVVHNRNAAALAEYFHALAMDPASPVAHVWYPPYSPGSGHLGTFLRKPTADYEAPGFGCLLSVEFETVAQAAAFYDALNFFQGPHLGAHLTLCMPYNFSKCFCESFPIQFSSSSPCEGFSQGSSSIFCPSDRSTGRPRLEGRSLTPVLQWFMAQKILMFMLRMG